MPLNQVISWDMDSFITLPTSSVGAHIFIAFYIKANLFDLVVGYDLITLSC